MTIGRSYYSLRVWSDDTRSTEVTVDPVSGTSRPIANITGGTLNLLLNDLNTYSLDCILQDPATGALGRGQFAELKIGWSSPLTLFTGYLRAINKTSSRSGAFTIDFFSALNWLNNRSVLGDAEYDYPYFQNVMDVLNGTNSVGVTAIPGEYGLLSGTGVTAVWIDGGTGLAPPGALDSWRADWSTVWQNIVALAQFFGFYVRERLGGTAHNCVLECGPLTDEQFELDGTTPVKFWGGATLLGAQWGWTDPVTGLQPYNSGNLFKPNARIAQRQGFHQILQAEFQDDTEQIHNIIWPTGVGNEDTLTTIKTVFGDVADSVGDPVSGVSKWTPWPGGQPYYIRSHRVLSWQGHYFALIARQQQPGTFAYGVADETSIGVPSDYSDGFTKYGPKEYYHHDPKASDIELCLSSGLGALENQSDPVVSWTFTCLFAVNGNGQFPIVEPGRKVAIGFEGVVGVPLEYDDAVGQSIPVVDEPFSYMSYPNTTDPELVTKLSRIMTVTYNLGSHHVECVLEMGKGKRNQRAADELLAARFMRHEHGKEGALNKFKERSWNKVNFILSTDAGHEAQVNPVNNHLEIQPEGFAYADVQATGFFNNSKGCRFDVYLPDLTSCVDFAFSKIPDGTLASETTTNPYGVLRLACTDSGKKCGFYSVTGGVYAAKGTLTPQTIMDTGTGRLPPGVTYTVHVTWEHKVLKATITAANAITGGEVAQVAMDRWVDPQTTGALSMDGSIGWHVLSGSSKVAISDVSVHPTHFSITERGALAPHVIGQHGWHNLLMEVTAFSDATVPYTCTVAVHVNGDNGYIIDNNGSRLFNEDGTPAEWTTDITGITGYVGMTLVYNSTGATVTGTRAAQDFLGYTIGPAGSVGAKSFGLLSGFEADQPRFAGVYKVGTVTAKADAHSGTVWIEGWQANAFKMTARQIHNWSVGRAALHPQTPTRWRLFCPYTNFIFQYGHFVSGSNNDYLCWPSSSELILDEGTTYSISDTNNGNSGGTLVLTDGKTLVLNSSASATIAGIPPLNFGLIDTIDLTDDTHVKLLTVGKVMTRDGITGNKYIQGYQTHVHRLQSAPIDANAVSVLSTNILGNGQDVGYDTQTGTYGQGAVFVGGGTTPPIPFHPIQSDRTIYVAVALTTSTGTVIDGTGPAYQTYLPFSAADPNVAPYSNPGSGQYMIGDALRYVVSTALGELSVVIASVDNLGDGTCQVSYFFNRSGSGDIRIYFYFYIFAPTGP